VLEAKKVGVLGLDLGGTSGLAWWCGVIDGEMSLRDTLRAGKFGFEQVDCGNGSVAGEREGALAIAKRYGDLSAEWAFDYVAVEDRYIAIEDFILRARIGSTARAGISSPRLAGLVEGILVREIDASNVARYSPARSKGFATSERLKMWGLWCRSAPHSRDAAKQVAIHVASLLDAAR
jgi:hypothetical protein